MSAAVAKALEKIDGKTSIGTKIAESLQNSLSDNVCPEKLHSWVRERLESVQDCKIHFAFSRAYRSKREPEKNIILNQELRIFLKLPDRGKDGWYRQDEVVEHFAQRSFPDDKDAQELVLKQTAEMRALIQAKVSKLPPLVFTVTSDKPKHSTLNTYPFIIKRNNELFGVLYVTDRLKEVPVELENYQYRVEQGFLVYPTAQDIKKLANIASKNKGLCEQAINKFKNSIIQNVKDNTRLPHLEDYLKNDPAFQEWTEYKYNDRVRDRSHQDGKLESVSNGRKKAAESGDPTCGSLGFGQPGEEGKSLDGIARIQFLERLILESNGLTISRLVELCNEIQAVTLPEDVAQRPEFKGCRNPKKHMDAYKIAALTKAQQVVRNLSKDIENAIRRVQNIPQNEKHTLNIYPVGGSPNTTKGPHGKILITDQYIPCRTSITLSELTAPLFSHLFGIEKTNPSEQPRNSSDLQCE